jgi:hypothetical protein
MDLKLKMTIYHFNKFAEKTQPITEGKVRSYETARCRLDSDKTSLFVFCKFAEKTQPITEGKVL